MRATPRNAPTAHCSHYKYTLRIAPQPRPRRAQVLAAIRGELLVLRSTDIDLRAMLQQQTRRADALENELAKAQLSRLATRTALERKASAEAQRVRVLKKKLAASASLEAEFGEVVSRNAEIEDSFGSLMGRRPPANSAFVAAAPWKQGHAAPGSGGAGSYPDTTAALRLSRSAAALPAVGAPVSWPSATSPRIQFAAETKLPTSPARLPRPTSSSGIGRVPSLSEPPPRCAPLSAQQATRPTTSHDPRRGAPLASPIPAHPSFHASAANPSLHASAPSAAPVPAEPFEHLAPPSASLLQPKLPLSQSELAETATFTGVPPPPPAMSLASSAVLERAAHEHQLATNYRDSLWPPPAVPGSP